jgi:hypothetical protein
MKKHHIFYILALFVALFAACKEDPKEPEPQGSIKYPATGLYGANILSDDVTEVNADLEYSMSTETPSGASLKIILKNGIWFYDPHATTNWTVSLYDDNTQSQTFTVTETGKISDLFLSFDDKDPNQSPITVEYYENGAVTPTKTKQLNIRL